MADTPATARRRFQFSLRTLMIGVTLVAVPMGYVGWQMKVIRERREAAATYQTIRGHESTVGPLRVFTIQRRPAPWPLRWMGEEGYLTIIVRKGTPADEIARLKRLFPEAVVEERELATESAL
jgi:hypothetical protein